jgi:NitT/TauT family transport system permease protein
VLRRSRFGLADLWVVVLLLSVLLLIAHLGAEASVAYHPNDQIRPISLNPVNLPDYAARSCLRMFIALACSMLFSLLYGSLAARHPLAERVLIPVLDLLQSVPVLGFLSLTVTGFIALFPGSLLGLEAASIFAIFTSQAWNMTFSFYQSLCSVPKELQEAAQLYRLTRWQRFSRVDVPFAAIPLLWNAMLSFGGGWFFVAASESISVLNHTYTLPGIGSYVTAAVIARDLPALGWAILAMVLLVLLVDQLFWRPLVAWCDRFRLDDSGGAELADSWAYGLLRVSQVPRLLGLMLAPLGAVVDGALSRLSGVVVERPSESREVSWPHWWRPALMLLGSLALAILAQGFVRRVGSEEVLYAVGLGCKTLARVLLLLLVASLMWTPIGVFIGFRPRWVRLCQPVVQFLASFPANFLFPLATVVFVAMHLPIGWGAVLLMALGSQWYILFNSIAGAQMIPRDLREMADAVGLEGWPRWRQLILPGIFSAWVTGVVTACGGAWNASIVSELVSWGHTTLKADGLGAYIAEATRLGDWSRISLGIGLMSVFVVGLNQLLWRRLYDLAERRYHL